MSTENCNANRLMSGEIRALIESLAVSAVVVVDVVDVVEFVDVDADD